jgi:hypothetical protein
MAPALNSAVTPPQPTSPTQPSGSSTTRMAGTVSSVAQTPRKTPFKSIPWWSACQDEPLQILTSTSGPQDSDTAGLVVEAESDSERDSDGDRPTTRHPLSLLDENSDAASEVCSVAPSANRTGTEGVATGRPTFDTAPQLSTSNADSFKIPERPSATEKMLCPVHPSVVRVMDKRLDAERPQYLVLCWMYPREGEAANSDVDRHFREYDEKVSRDLAREERLSTLRARKRIRKDGRQNPDRARKRARIQTTAFASQTRTYPSRQVVEDLFLDVVCPLSGPQSHLGYEVRCSGRRSEAVVRGELLIGGVRTCKRGP